MIPTYEKQLTSLFEYVERFQESEHLFDARQEILIAKHTLQTGVLTYEGLVTSIRDKYEMGVEVSIVELKLLQTAADKVRADAAEFVTLLKKVAEIEVLLSSKFDALQVLALLSQVPKLIANHLEATLLELLEDLQAHIKETIPEELHKTEWFKKIFKHEFLNPAYKMHVAQVVKHVTGKLDEEIKALNVPGVEKPDAVQDADRAVILEEVQTMIESVPSE